MPGALSTALGVLYSDDNTNPAKGLAYDRDTQATALFYESMRMFAPVVGFPERPAASRLRGGDGEEAPG